MESVEGSGEFSSSESDETEEVVEAKTNEIDVGGCKGADVSLTIHEQLDFTKLQQVCGDEGNVGVRRRSGIATLDVRVLCRADF